MRSEKEMLDLILGFAKNDERVRSVIMNGSRTNTNAPKDMFQDYDIVYVVNKLETFINDNNWIDIFGKRILMQKPEAKTSTLLPPENTGAFAYLMLFKDGGRIDLTLVPQERQNEILGNDSLTIVLLDKDNSLPYFEKASDKDYWEKPPTNEMFNECCNEFWWVLQNTAKGIWRDELPYAKHMLCYSRDMLDKMISWYIGMQHDYKIAAGKMGKYFKRYLDGNLWDMYQKTYSDGNYDNFWESIFICCGLFRITSKKIAEHFQYRYPIEEDEGMTGYLEWVKGLGK